jgi:type 1 fimbria pilin
MKINKMFFLILFMFPFYSYGNMVSTTSTNPEVSVDIPITANIISPTCSINNMSSGGLSQTIDMGFYTAQEIATGKVKEIDVPLIIDCSGSYGVYGVAFSFSKLGSYSAVGYSQPGSIRTSLNGISLSLMWKIDNTPVDLSDGYEKLLANNSSNLIDGSIKAKLLLMPSFSVGTIEKGRLRSGINVSTRYY